MTPVIRISKVELVDNGVRFPSNLPHLVGDISEQFNPIIGENSETSSLAGVSPSRMTREEGESRESVNIIMADSDDSL